MKSILFTLGVSTLLVLGSCARPGTPTGGPKDTTAPKVDTAASTRNFTTRFKSRRIELTFDEWVVLKEPSKQIVVSPPLQKQPQTRIKGKTVILEFDDLDTLRANTTYTVNYGTAVRDLHEDNPAIDLRFVFSTGDVIDSLQLRGKVVDALSGKPVENAIVMLYESQSDSIVSKEKPYYFTRTNKNGQFALTNLREGNFKCVAIIDDGVKTLQWDPSEQIAFTDSLVTVRDTFQMLPLLRLSKNQPSPRLISKNPDVKTYGKTKLSFSAPPDSVVLRTDRTDITLVTRKLADSLFVWYHAETDSVAWQLFVGQDTIAIPALSGATALKNFNLLWAEDASPGKGSRKFVAPVAETGKRAPRLVTLLPGRKALLPFSHPVLRADTSLFVLMVDTVRLHGFGILPDSANPTAFRMQFPWMAGKSYRLELLPGAITSLYGIANRDTLARTFTLPAEKQLGALNLTLEGLIPGNNYVLQLTDNNIPLDERRFTATESTRLEKYTGLQTLAYSLVLVEDRNKNGRWDGSDYYAHRQPEQIFSKKMDALRANWELEATFNVGSDPKSKK